MTTREKIAFYWRNLSRTGNTELVELRIWRKAPNKWPEHKFVFRYSKRGSHYEFSGYGATIYQAIKACAMRAGVSEI